MSRLKPVSYDVIEGEDRFVLIVRCEPLKGPMVTMHEVEGHGFEFRDEEGGSIRFGNPHARMRGATGKSMILVMIQGDGMSIATTSASSRLNPGTELIPAEFLWHHDRPSRASDYSGRPFVALMEHVLETTAGILCAPPVGAPVSACIHRRMTPLSGDREWSRVVPKLLVDAGSIDQVVEVPSDVSGAVVEAFTPGGTPSAQGAAWRSQLAIRLAA